ncbi:hypothetical protein BHE74_00039503 [Ensete ventricosum]|nr:hypothetical protein GW17_00004341 [Ensete ventricosum]RWW53955.1 hypothetical protein BHE74_00039503 [Ensete ventricosum]RZS22147.1 hypothetical protein BHM03_00054884 [Ensete ventricosum]
MLQDLIHDMFLMTWQVLNDETFAVMVLMALFTTFITTPTVMAIYKPARAHEHRKLHRSASSSPPSAASDPKELRVLACAHSPRDAPSLITLIEAIRGGARPRSSPLKLYVLHLVELTERSSSIVMVRRARHNGLPFLNPLIRRQPRDQVALAFNAYGQLSRVRVRSMAAVSALPTMHEDICSVAEDKRVSLLIVPFHKRQHRSRGDDGAAAIENVGHGWRSVNQRVLREAPCSVAVLVDRGFGEGEQVGPTEVTREVCVLFFGGPDDREAVELASRMAEHLGIRVTVVRFITQKSGNEDRQNVTLRPSPLKSAEKSYTFSTAVMDRERENKDEAAVEAFRSKTDETEGSARYEEKTVGNVIEAVLTIGRSGAFDLVVVGKGRFPTSMVAELAGLPAEHPELGPIGDALTSSSNEVVSSVLVVQQHDVVHSEETPVSLVLGDGADAVVLEVDGSKH